MQLCRQVAWNENAWLHTLDNLLSRETSRLEAYQSSSSRDRSSVTTHTKQTSSQALQALTCCRISNCACLFLSSVLFTLNQNYSHVFWTYLLLKDENPITTTQFMHFTQFITLNTFQRQWSSWMLTTAKFPFWSHLDRMLSSTNTKDLTWRTLKLSSLKLAKTT